MRAGETVATQGGSLYDPNLFLGRSPQPVYDEGSTRSAVRHAYGFPFPISATRHSQPESRDPASHPGTVPCTGTATNKIEFFRNPTNNTRSTASRCSTRGRARARFFRREQPRLHPPRTRSTTSKFRNLRCDRTRQYGVRDSVQYGIQCTTAHVRYSTAYSARRHMFDTIRCTVRDGT